MTQIRFSSAETLLLIKATTYFKKVLIDDAMDDPEADHSTNVLGLIELIRRLEQYEQGCHTCGADYAEADVDGYPDGTCPSCFSPY